MMLVYRANADSDASGRQLLADLVDAAGSLAASARPRHDAIVDLLVDAGMLESAVADASYAECERALPETVALHRATRSIAHACIASWDRNERSCREWLSHAIAHARQIDAAAIPERVTYRVPEGYAFSGLYPESYLETAREVWAERRPQRAICLGIRSIGSSLAGVVSAALEQRGSAVASWTLRPVGHPFDRRVCISRELAASLLAHPVDLALVVDEGPGLSGSSFAAAAEALAGIGVPRDRIVLLPSWLPDAEGLVSERARNVWRNHAKAHVAFERTWVDSGRLGAAFSADSVEDLSAGAWRTRWMTGREADWPAIQPQHERRKYLARSHAGHRRVLKFAGLGRFGRRLLTRAHALHGTAAAVEHLELSAGFLARPEIRGALYSEIAGTGSDPFSSALAADKRSPPLVTIAEYLSQIGRRFRTSAAADMNSLAEMMLVNAEELPGAAPTPKLRALADEARRWNDVPAVLLDNRMFPREWIATDRGLVKLDALEHHDDHFYPGPHDIAWDAAGTIVEFGLEGDAEDGLVAQIASALGDSHLPARMPFFVAAYLAFRAGYCSLGASALGDTPDAARLRAAAARYTQALRVKS